MPSYNNRKQEVIKGIASLRSNLSLSEAEDSKSSKDLATIQQRFRQIALSSSNLRIKEKQQLILDLLNNIGVVDIKPDWVYSLRFKPKNK